MACAVRDCLCLPHAECVTLVLCDMVDRWWSVEENNNNSVCLVGDEVRMVLVDESSGHVSSIAHSVDALDCLPLATSG